MNIFLPLLLLALCGCSPEPAAQGDVAALRAGIAKTAALDEHDAKSVQVAHILIAFQGAERSSQTRSREEAEVLVASLAERIQAGEDFEALGKEFSNDPGGGPYVMSTDGSGGYPRASMATSFGDVAWRLDVGQVGVCAYDPVKSKFGWHIIKRLR